MARRPTRGSTLIEVLIASAIFIIGLTGITTLMYRSRGDMRDGNASMNSSMYANAALSDVMQFDFANLTAGTNLDAGIVYDGNGLRYVRTMDIVAGGSSNIPTYNVTVHVNWRDSFGRNRVTTTSVMMSRRPDAG